MAQKLLSEYNLDQAQLGEGATETGDAVREKLNEEIAIVYPWKSELIEALAKNNFCTTWTDRVFAKPTWGYDKARWRNRQRLIGRRVNIVVTIETYKYLVAAMERLCPYTDKRDRSTKSWYKGCSDRLVQRLDIQRYRAERASAKQRDEAPRGDGSSLVVLTDVYSSEADLNNDLRYGYPAGTTSTRRREYLAAAKARKPEPEVEMTPEEAAAAAKEYAKWEKRWQREQERKEAQIDRAAYNRGNETGGDIGLDRQINEEKAKRLK
jgi:hypothetical protein